MALKQIEIPSLNRSISCLMAAPSSAEPGTHEQGLDRYRVLGGNCLHLHGEGGETHSRIATGKWLAKHHLRREFFVCTQICHEGWDEEAKQPIDRFTPAAVTEDITTDLELLGADYVDLVYLDDKLDAPFEPIIDALAHERESGRIRAFGVRNWTPKRILAAQNYAGLTVGTGLAALITTELALPIASAPMWPAYVPFDSLLMDAVSELGLVVLAHAGDVTSGQCVFGNEDSSARWRPEWVSRWEVPANREVARAVQTIAARHGSSTREVSLAWMLSRRFPVVALVGLPALLSAQGDEYLRASQLTLDEAELRLLDAARSTGQ